MPSRHAAERFRAAAAGTPVRLARHFARLSVAFACFLALVPHEAVAQQARPASAAARRLQARIQAILRAKEAQQAFWGIEVVSLADGRRLLGINSDKLFTPASTAKLFTAAAALTRLGPDFVYQTTVEANGPLSPEGRLSGDLFLVGRGDPNLSGRVLPYAARTERTEFPAKVFEQLAEQVARAGVRIVEGSVVADDSYFVFQPYVPSWAVGDLLWSFGAPVTALAFNDNTVYLHVQPGPQAEGPAVVFLEPAQPYQIENRVVTTPAPADEAAALPRNELGVERLPGFLVLQVWGRISQGSPEQIRAIAVDDPPKVAGEIFLQALQQRGVEVRGTVQVREQYPFEVPELQGAIAPPAASATTVLASAQSLALSESLKVILKISQNLHAEMLLRTLGRERRGVGSMEAGLAELQEFARETDIPKEHILLRDGSGLSRQSLVTPSAMVAVLRRMQRSAYGPLWMELLPLAGQDGTLLRRLDDKRFVGRILAKTGTLSGTTALAGYAQNRRNQWLAFAIFVNHHNLTATEAAALLDRMVEEIALSR